MRRQGDDARRRAVADGLVKEGLSEEAAWRLALEPSLSGVRVKVDSERLLSMVSVTELGTLVGAGVAEPVKASANGSQVGFSRFFVCLDRAALPAREELLSEIDGLDPHLSRGSSWLATHPFLFEEHRRELEAVSRWMASPGFPPRSVISRGQRSFQVLGDEKALDGPLSAILSRCGVDDETLGVRTRHMSQMQCFHPIAGATCMPFLVVENADPFHSIARLLRERGTGSLAGEPVGGVIYGCGNSAAAPDAVDGLLDDIGYRLGKVLYAGDVDREGVSILCRVRAAMRRELRPHVGLYRLMCELELHRERMGLVPERAAPQDPPSDATWLLEAVGGPGASVMRRCLSENLRVPQEIVTDDDYEEAFDA